MKRIILLVFSRLLLVISALWMVFGFLISRELSWDFIMLAIVAVVFVLPFVLCLLLHRYIKGKVTLNIANEPVSPKETEPATVNDIMSAVEDVPVASDIVPATDAEEIKSEPQDVPADVKSSRADALGFALADDGHYRSYVYQFVDIAFPVADGLTLYNTVTFEREPDNQYDPGAVCVMHSNVKIGYLYRGKLQKMVADFVDRDNYVSAYVDSVDVDKFTIAIAFYKPLASVKFTSAALVKTTKKDSWGCSRQDSLLYVAVDDVLDLDYDLDSETYIVSTDSGNEVGELSKSVSQKLYDHKSDYIAVCEEIGTDDNGKLKCKVAIIEK